MCDSYLTTTESFNAMTKEVRVAAPSFSRLLIDITSIWASHLASSWMEAGSATNALTRSKQPTLDALKDTATTLGAQKQAPGCVIVHSDLDPGGLMSVISSDSGFRATGATWQCTYLAVVGLPCAHVIAGANAISGPRVAHVAAASFVHKAHTQRALYEVYGVLGNQGLPNPTTLQADSLQPPVWVEESRRALEAQRDAERAISRGMECHAVCRTSRPQLRL